jgi:hypothetical protein
MTAAAMTAAVAVALSACGSDEAPRATGKPAAARSADPEAIASARERGFFNESEPPQGDPREEHLEERPCDVVTASQARSAFGVAMRKPKTGQQGPTCIYRTRSGKGFMTLAVLKLDGKQLKPMLEGSEKLKVSGRQAYCGTASMPTLYVPLPADRTLTIGAIPERPRPGADQACDLPREIAAKAIAKLVR